jgi:hypothetical protein
MIVSGISREDLEHARDVASRILGNELVFSEFHSYRPNRHRVRLQVADIDDPGARRHPHAYMMGYAKRPRRSRFACGHAYGMLFVAIYEREPHARIQTAMAVYSDVWGFLGTYEAVLDKNSGSVMVPVRYADECTCVTDDIYDDPLRPYLWDLGGVPELPNATNTQGIGAGV